MRLHNRHSFPHLTKQGSSYNRPKGSVSRLHPGRHNRLIDAGRFPGCLPGKTPVELQIRLFERFSHKTCKPEAYSRPCKGMDARRFVPPPPRPSFRRSFPALALRKQVHAFEHQLETLSVIAKTVEVADQIEIEGRMIEHK